MNNNLGTKLGLKIKLTSFEKFWTWVALVQILSVLSEFYLFYKLVNI